MIIDLLEIQARLDAIQEFIKNESYFYKIRELLKQLPDLDSIIAFVILINLIMGKKR